MSEPSPQGNEEVSEHADEGAVELQPSQAQFEAAVPAAHAVPEASNAALTSAPLVAPQPQQGQQPYQPQYAHQHAYQQQPQQQQQQQPAFYRSQPPAAGQAPFPSSHSSSHSHVAHQQPHPPQQFAHQASFSQQQQQCSTSGNSASSSAAEVAVNGSTLALQTGAAGSEAAAETATTVTTCLGEVEFMPIFKARYKASPGKAVFLLVLQLATGILTLVSFADSNASTILIFLLLAEALHYNWWYGLGVLTASKEDMRNFYFHGGLISKAAADVFNAYYSVHEEELTLSNLAHTLRWIMKWISFAFGIAAVMILACIQRFFESEDRNKDSDKKEDNACLAFFGVLTVCMGPAILTIVAAASDSPFLNVISLIYMFTYQVAVDSCLLGFSTSKFLSGAATLDMLGFV